MTFNIQGRRRRLFILLIGLSLFFIPKFIFAQFELKLPQPPRTVDLFEEKIFGLEAYTIDSTFFAKKPGNYKRSITLDSSGTYITIQETMDDVEFFFPAVIDLDNYVQQRLKFNERQMVKQTFSDGIKNQQEADFGAIELDIPFRIKSETFTRIFGSDRISLRVTGNITFDLSGRTEDRSGSKLTARESQNNFSPRFNQTQQFTVEGKIGEKVTVSVQQNSEAVTDIDNTLKLRYDGEEDEIVEKIEAGNISLSLPSTKYVIFGGQNKGLFGLKAQMRMGNLHLTTIASIEKGEQQELKISGNASASTSRVKDTDFIKDRYYFIDNSYKEDWEGGYSEDLQTFAYTGGTLVTQLEVWVSENSTVPGVRTGIALVNPDPDIDPDTVAERNKFKGSFRQLSEDQFGYDAGRGFFWVNQNIGTNTALAISYATENGIPYGTQFGDSSDSVILKLIKTKNQTPSDTTWNLMMRNVYSLGGSQIQPEGFEVSIRHTTKDTDFQGNNTFLTLLGLDILDESQAEGPDNLVDANGMLINLNRGILIFPNLTPFDPIKDTKFSGLDESNIIPIYNVAVTDQENFHGQSRFEILVQSKSTKSTFDLGFYVLEGSDLVTLNGKTLQRDKDYSIDYFSGQLTLISNEAKRSSAELDIKYERANLFQLDKKTILGGRLEYNFLDDSFVGATALYLNKSTVDRRVRVGQEPFQNFVWDLNAAFKFKPRFLTDAIDALPFIETSDESQFNIEGEFAQVIPDPNTLDNSSTGDNNGVAYVDDFEASKRSTTLGIRYRTWTQASAPVKLPGIIGEIDNHAASLDKTRANLTWFNPYNQFLIKSIWPERDVNSQTGQTTDVLGLEYYLDEGAPEDSSWAGIMRSTASFADQQRTKYIELWVNGTVGTFHVDVGKISEDWWVRGKNLNGALSLGNLNTEDKDGLGFLEDGEDTGIDGIAKNDSGDTDIDDWKNIDQNPADWPFARDYRGINGTEGNSGASGARYPDTEDLDGDGELSRINQYYTYSFSLDPDDFEAQKWIAGETEAEDGSKTGWRLFRIPISEPTESVGDPNETLFQQILNTRLRITGFNNTDPVRTFIAAFDFVGNEWEETGILKEDLVIKDNREDILIPKGRRPAIVKEFDFEKADSIFVLATYNTEENTFYESPPGVSGVKDRITKARSKEQSLIMQFNDFPGGAIAEARKTLFSKIELINYKRLKMFMYGHTIEGSVNIPENTDHDSSDITFYLRFGSDENNFYEYGQDVFQGWNKLNKIDIDLDELAALSGFDGGEIRYLDNVPGGYYRAFGNTVSLKIIRYFVIGARNKSGENFTGEIWLDELRLSDVRAETATALRLKTNIKLADLLRFSGEWESKDADFHNISTQFGSGNTLERQSYTANFNFDKFLPVSWDLSIPIDARASFTRNIPKYLPRSDDLTGYKNDTFSQKVKSLFGLRKLPDELKEVVSKSENIGAGTTIKKRGTSKHWLPKYTIDQITLDFDFAKQERSSWELKYNKSLSFKERYTFKIPFSNKNYFEPFKFARTIPVLKSIYDTKIYYSPNNINFNLSVTDTKTENLRRDSTATVTRTKNTGTTRSLNTSYKFLPKMNVTYSRSHITDADFDSISRSQLYEGIFTKLDFGKEIDVSQKFGIDYKPDLFSWLKPTYKYDATFRYQLVSGYKYKQAVNRTTNRIGANISPSKLVNLIYTPADKKAAPQSRRRGRPKKKVAPKEGEEEKKDEPEEKKESAIPNPLMLVYNLFDSWDKVNMTFSIDENVNNQYLSDIPKWDYQLGFTQDPGVPQEQSVLENGNITVLPKPTSQETRSLKTSTSFNVAKKVKISLNHDYKTTSSITNNGNTKTGGTATSFLALGKDPLKDFGGVEDDLLRFIPEWKVNVSGVEEFLFFDKFAKSITVDHGHTGKYDEKRTLGSNGKFEPNQQSFTNSWSPLIGFNIRTIWDVSATVRVNNNTSYSYRPSGTSTQTSGATRTSNNSFTISMNYATKAGFKIPIPVWPFKGRTFKNEINFSLTFDSSDNTSYARQAGKSKFQEQSKNSSWKLRPSATYKFNSRVQGSMFFETGTTTNKISGEYSYSEFGINVNIAIRD